MVLYHKEAFKAVSHPKDLTGVPEGEPRIREVIVNMGDHNTVVTVTHGTLPEYVILVHGYPLSQQIWNPLVEEFSIQARNGRSIPTLITYDLRGCGSAITTPISGRYLDSDPMNVEWTLDLFANDLHRIYTEIVGVRTNDGIRKISIGGWGFGGCIAQKFALQNPHLINKLYLFSTLGIANTDNTAQIRNLSQRAIQHGYSSLATLPINYINRLMCEWFNVEDDSVCPNTKDTENDIGTLQYQVAQSLLSSANLAAELQVLKLMSTSNLLLCWTQAPKFTYDVVFVAPTNDQNSSPNQVLKLYTAIKNKYSGLRQPSLLTPVGKHYYVLQNPQLIVSIICPTCTLQYDKSRPHDPTALNAAESHLPSNFVAF